MNGIPNPMLSPTARGHFDLWLAGPLGDAETEVREVVGGLAGTRVRVRDAETETVEVDGELADTRMIVGGDDEDDCKLEETVALLVGLTPATAEDTEGANPKALIASLQQSESPLVEQQKSPSLTAESGPVQPTT
ncbi:hypothetical protein P7C71_g2531, partial [Lecanoromycetidae sp. Uapishka_2]